MDKCTLCGGNFADMKYIVPNSVDKCICQQCNDRIALCIANRDDEVTHGVREILSKQMEDNTDRVVRAYLSSVLKLKNDGNSTEVDPSAEKGIETTNLKMSEENGVFANIGRTIKRVTKVFFWIEIICCVIAGFMVIIQDSYYNPTVGIGLAIWFAGPLLAWLGSIFSYGFGELIEQSKRHNQLLSELLKNK